MHSMIRVIFLALVLSFALSPNAMHAALPVEARNDRDFMSWLTSLTEQVAQDEHYQRIPLDDEHRVDEFTIVLHDVFRGRMTDADFTDWVARKYPGYRYETATILKLMHVHRKVSGW